MPGAPGLGTSGAVPLSGPAGAMTSADGDWMARARAALAAPAPPVASPVDVLRGHRPPVLDSTGWNAVLAPFLAMLGWTGAIFRELVSDSPIDPIALFLRLLALGLTMRAIILGISLARPLGPWLRARAWAIALTPEGALVRTPAGDVPVSRDDVVAIREEGDWRTRKVGRRWADVYLVLHPRAGRTHVTLPPVFERTPGELAERL